jgi:hypothetical protein
MFTLDAFYKSHEWQKLLAVLKLERVDDDGNLICWHCGKPIVRKYDAIGHHTIFLTEENVNDASISLNPELIQFVHHRCHNIIHNKFGYKRKEIFLVYGPPLSGKHEWVANQLTDGELVINIDDLWMAVSGLPRYQKPGRLNAVVFQQHRDLMDAVRTRLGKWNTAYIVGGYPLISERERICKDYGAREIFIDKSKEECMARAKELKLEDYDCYIDEWFRRYRPPYPV